MAAPDRFVRLIIFEVMIPLMFFGIILIGPLLMTLGCYFLALVFKDEFLYYNDQWIKDGKPFTIFWQPPKSHISNSSHRTLWTYGKYQIRWLFITPSWIRNNKKTFRKLWIYRIISPLGLLVFALALSILKML